MRPVLSRVAPQRVGPIAVAGSALLHGSLALMIVAASRMPRPPRALPAYRVELVAAPRAAGSEASAGTAPAPGVTTSPRAVEPARRTPAAPAPAPAPAPRPQPAPAAPRGAPAATAPAETPTPGTSQGQPGGVGRDAATIRTEGVEFPFPGYLRNLVAQVYRRWRPPEGNANLEAEILFLVHRDGSISGIQFVRRSGSFAFDLEAQGAIEAAGRSSVFGPLPGGYGADVLPVSFFFSPRSLR